MYGTLVGSLIRRTFVVYRVCMVLALGKLSLVGNAITPGTFTDSPMANALKHYMN